MDDDAVSDWSTRMLLWMRWGGRWHVVMNVRGTSPRLESDTACGLTDYPFNIVVRTHYGLTGEFDPSMPSVRSRMCRRCLAALEAAGERGEIQGSK